MKISVNWLRQFTDINLPIDKLVEKIGAQLGAVEEISDLGKIYQHIVIAEVISCKKHPNADKLSVCKIDDGGKVRNVERDENGHIQVVCGAPNVRAGLKVAWLPPGATVPSTSGRDPFVLGSRELRGAVSNGMIASAAELAIGDDHSGIVELDATAGPGTDFADAYELNDHIIDIENKMFTHRPDCFGILGVAREVAGIQQKPFRSPDWYARSDGQRALSKEQGVTLEVINRTGDLVPRLIAAAMSDVEVRPSPFIIQTYLARVGIKPINNIVDASNYMMYLTGQPTHAYDADKLRAVSAGKEQGAVRLETRMSRKGDKLKLLGGKEIKFEDDDTILITSGDVPVGIGGVMGGADTEVDESTKNIVIECANFDMYSIRRASMKYGLFTDAVTRFNKGQSALQNAVVFSELAAKIEEVSGGHLSSKVVDSKSNEQRAKKKEVGVTADFVNARLGLKLPPSEMAKLLRNVEFEVEVKGGKLDITPPFWRMDIEIAEDIVEEVGRLYGYDHLPLELPRRSIRPTAKNELLELKNQIRSILSRAGANEVLSYSFVHGDLLEKASQDREAAFRISNALSPDLQYYRLSLLPSLLEKARLNTKAGYDEFSLFELGKYHNKRVVDEQTDLPDEANSFEMVYTSTRPKSGAAYYRILLQTDYLLAKLGIEYYLKPAENEFFHQAFRVFDHERSALIMNSAGRGGTLGVVGELKSPVLRAFKLPEYTSAVLIGLDGPGFYNHNRLANVKYTRLSRYQTVRQDITLKVKDSVSYADIHKELVEGLNDLTGEKYRAGIKPQDIYQKDKSKNFSFRLEIAHYEKTLKSAEVNELLDKLAAKANQKFGAERI